MRQVLAASVFLAVLLAWSGQELDWIALKVHGWQRVGWLALILSAAVVVYFGVLWVVGLKLRQLLQR